jgi:hypothetical protein
MLVNNNFLSLTNVGGQKRNTYDRFRLRGGRTLLGQEFQPKIRLYEATVFYFILFYFIFIFKGFFWHKLRIQLQKKTKIQPT